MQCCMFMYSFITFMYMYHAHILFANRMHAILLNTNTIFQTKVQTDDKLYFAVGKNGIHIGLSIKHGWW